MDNTNNNNKSKRKFRTPWWVWFYLIVFYTDSSFVYYEQQVTAQDEQKAQEEIQSKIEFESVEYELSLKEIKNGQEVWNTYTVNVIDGKESSGTYWLDNSKTDGYIIKLKFEDDGSIRIEEWTDDKIRVRHLARLTEGTMSIKDYNEIVVETDDTE